MPTCAALPCLDLPAGLTNLTSLHLQDELPVGSEVLEGWESCLHSPQRLAGTELRFTALPCPAACLITVALAGC